MTGFATGFSHPTTPGFWLQNSQYKVQFQGVDCDNAGDVVELAQAFGFQCCYNWSEVIKLILVATEEAGNDNTVDIEEAVEESLKGWLTSFQGWGLLSSLVPVASIRHIVLSLAYISDIWDVDRQGEYSVEKVFNTVKEMHDNIQGKEIGRSLPKTAIWFEEIVTGGEENERKKNLTLCFYGKWVLEAKFVVEKLRVNRNLKELSAETLVRNIYNKEEVENLEIPNELLDTVRSKFSDAEWVRDHWRLKAHLEEPEYDCFEHLVEETHFGEVAKSDLVSNDVGQDVKDDSKFKEKVIGEGAAEYKSQLQVSVK